MKKRKKFAVIVYLSDGIRELPYRVYLTRKKASAFCKEYNDNDHYLFADYMRVELL